jgi:hypothetical protein
MADEEIVTVKQDEGERFALDHGGAVALHGDARRDALRHEVAGKVVHATAPQQPLVHVVSWDEDCSCEISGRVALVGDEKAPIAVRMGHKFENEHRQSHRIETALHQPVHHALQMRTPLQVRFCNPWHVASDYVLDVRVGDRSVLSVRLTGATVATPQPCADDAPCPPAVSTMPSHP